MDIQNFICSFRSLVIASLFFACMDSTKNRVLEDKQVFTDTLDEALSMVYEGRPTTATKPFLLVDSTFTMEIDGIASGTIIKLDERLDGEMAIPRWAGESTRYEYINYNQWLQKGKKADSITAIVQPSRVLLHKQDKKVFYRLSIIGGKGHSGGEYEIIVKKHKGMWQIAGLELIGVY